MEGLRHLFAIDKVGDNGALPVRRYSGATVHRQSSAHPWNNQNPSTYTTRRGLRAACWESRSVVTKRQRPQSATAVEYECRCNKLCDLGWPACLTTARHDKTQRGECRCPQLCEVDWSPCTTWDDSDICDCRKLCDLGWPASLPNANTDKTCVLEADDRGGKEYFQVSPHDLICVKPDDLVRVFVTNQTTTSCYCQGSEHVALEFDPVWAGRFLCEDLSWPMGELIETYHPNSGILSAHLRLQRLWLIDYRLKRRFSGKGYESKQTPQNRAVFYGNGCRFVEVRQGDSGWELEGRELAAEKKPHLNPFRFIKRAHDKMSWHSYPEGDTPEMTTANAECPCGFQGAREVGAREVMSPDGTAVTAHGPMLGVLACEPWEEEL